MRPENEINREPRIETDQDRSGRKPYRRPEILKRTRLEKIVAGNPSIDIHISG